MLTDRLRKNVDIPMLVLTALLGVLGVVMLFSATRVDPSAALSGAIRADASSAWKKQIIWLVIGSAGMVGAVYLDYHVLTRWSRHIYLGNLAMLLVVLKFAHSINGAARWINLAGFKFQPSEFAKLFVIVTLAVFLTKNHERIKEFGTFMLSLAYIALPMLLIFRQPDLGTALVVLAIWAGMVFIAGAKLTHLVSLVMCGALLVTGLWVSGKVIKPYMKRRIMVYLFPDMDRSGAGWQVSQAKTVIGSGQFLGKGFLQGQMVHGGYIPERQTDFIYTTVGEELGFVGCVGLVMLYGLLLFRGALIIAAANEDTLGKLIATGVVSMFAFHVILNIGMNIGILPVAGVPLPLISAGGSNVILMLIGVGLLESVAIHRHQLMF
jgi:rod shape determining protein RodA